MDENAKMRSMELADEQILELYWRRDEQAIKQTEIKYGKMLFRIAFRILHDKAESEECQNDTYLSVWNRIPPMRPAVFRAFIAKIARDVAVDKYRSKSGRKRVPSELTVSLEDLSDAFPSDDSIDERLAIEELSKMISIFVRGLPARQHYIFIGRFYFGSTLAEIADELGISVATVQREIVKLKQALGHYLEKNGVCV